MEQEVELIKTTVYDLGGRTALITGGASGLGKATARRFLDSHANVVIADWNDEGAQVCEQLNQDFAHTGMRSVFIKTDVSDPAQMKAAVDFAVSTFGHLDILVASAGIGGANNAIADETIENWNKVNAVDYTGVMLADKYAIEQFLKQGKGGAVVNLASMFGLVAVPSNVAYSAAKGGVVNLTKAAGTAYAHEGIRVNCVCPGVINTPLVPEDQKQAYRQMHPMHRIGEAFEIAAIITFLVSAEARFITGAAIPVDGGYTGV
ncbi:MAG: SDR family oxidoreductase [Oscillospiraceae bacterium]|nr:SDR family oxidoreductase [Oscillospiraceae bacterium]